MVTNPINLSVINLYPINSDGFGTNVVEFSGTVNSAASADVSWVNRKFFNATVIPQADVLSTSVLNYNGVYNIIPIANVQSLPNIKSSVASSILSKADVRGLFIRLFFFGASIPSSVESFSSLSLIGVYANFFITAVLNLMSDKNIVLFNDKPRLWYTDKHCCVYP